MTMENGKADRILVMSFSEMLIDFMPTVTGVSLAEAPGFVKALSGFIIAITVACPGGRSAFIGKLGDNEFSRMLARILRDNGIVDIGVTFNSGACTALAFITLRADRWMWNE